MVQEEEEEEESGEEEEEVGLCRKVRELRAWGIVRGRGDFGEAGRGVDLVCGNGEGVDDTVRVYYDTDYYLYYYLYCYSSFNHVYYYDCCFRWYLFCCCYNYYYCYYCYYYCYCCCCCCYYYRANVTMGFQRRCLENSEDTRNCTKFVTCSMRVGVM